MLSLLGFLSETLLDNVEFSEPSSSSRHGSEEHRHAVCLSWPVSRHLFELRRPLSEVLVCHHWPRWSSLPAAAAGSSGVLGVFLSSAPGLKGVFGAKGLRLRCVSEVLLVGERERLSKREERFTSGSVWSNLERFETLRSSSAISRWCRDS